MIKFLNLGAGGRGQGAGVDKGKNFRFEIWDFRLKSNPKFKIQNPLIELPNAPCPPNIMINHYYAMATLEL
ncbi:MAG: hypothetical protein ACRAVC_14240 [Trichormus sp.]